jgi:hypothetical protein
VFLINSFVCKKSVIMKKMFNYVVVSLLATTMVSCDDSNKDDAFGSATFIFTSNASLDLLEAANVIITITDNYGVIHEESMSTIQWGKSIVNINSLPANAIINVRVELKDDFIPVAGEKYDFDFNVLYAVQVVEKDGELDESRMGSLWSVTTRGVESEKLKETFKLIFPESKEFKLGINHKPRDKNDYVITIDELRN